MATTIQIGSTIIEFPDSGEQEDWAPSITAFALAVEAALNLVVGPFDVAPQLLTIDAYNPGTNIDMPNFAFPVSDVRAVHIVYSVFRNTSLVTAAETGTLEIVYNPNAAPGSKWEKSREGTGIAFIDFNVTDVGQVTFTTTAIAGASHVGSLTYIAKALLQD